MKRPRAFAPQKAALLLSYVRQGGFPLVAAEAAGVSADAFERWLRRGEEAPAREPYRGFHDSLGQALAQARLLAELAVAKKDPKFWLISGPGRDLPASPGWARPSAAVVEADAAEDSAEHLHQTLQLVATSLQPHPEASQAVTDALDRAPHIDKIRNPTSRRKLPCIYRPNE